MCRMAAILVVASGCSGIEGYSVRMAERSCSALQVCSVYGASGVALSPCISTNAGAIYPGDPRWPYTTPGVCDVVRDGRVVSSREDASTGPDDARPH